MEADSVPLRWNRTAVPTVAIMFLTAAFVPTLLFGNPQMAFTAVVGWFLITSAVQFWGSRADRVIAIVALVLMIAAVLLPLILGGSAGVGLGVVSGLQAG